MTFEAARKVCDTATGIDKVPGALKCNSSTAVKASWFVMPKEQLQYQYHDDSRFFEGSHIFPFALQPAWTRRYQNFIVNPYTATSTENATRNKRDLLVPKKNIPFCRSVFYALDWTSTSDSRISACSCLIVISCSWYCRREFRCERLSTVIMLLTCWVPFLKLRSVLHGNSFRLAFNSPSLPRVTALMSTLRHSASSNPPRSCRRRH